MQERGGFKGSPRGGGGFRPRQGPLMGTTKTLPGGNYESAGTPRKKEQAKEIKMGSRSKILFKARRRAT